MTGFARIGAFTVHVFTATGAALALLALILATGGHWAGMFFCLGMALVVDGLDGPMARAFEVEKLLPRWSGNTLDLVVDFDPPVPKDQPPLNWTWWVKTKLADGTIAWLKNPKNFRGMDKLAGK